VSFAGRQIYVKRDDLLNEYFSGNKARKFAYFLDHHFTGITTLIAYGSVQANSLYSLAALAKLKHWQLNYYVEKIPNWLKQQPIGNYAGALTLGANIIERGKNEYDAETNLDSYMSEKALTLPDTSLFIPEGGRCAYAKYGIEKLADEITVFCQENNLHNPQIMLPAGTGTTALFLQLLLPFKVLTCACVGGDSYLKKQFSELESNSTLWPEILTNNKKYHFGKLYPEFYTVWQQLKQQTDIEFDLLYDPLGWLTLLTYLEQNNENNEIIYIHQGGLLGNESMLPRYQRKYSQL
jgi:1-aminocyclopropane-1-carboxylate deaminase